MSRADPVEKSIAISVMNLLYWHPTWVNGVGGKLEINTYTSRTFNAPTGPDALMADSAMTSFGRHDRISSGFERMGFELVIRLISADGLAVSKDNSEVDNYHFLRRHGH